MKTQSERQRKAAERKAEQARFALAQEGTRRVVATGQCPLCGTALRRNNALTGWWQCDAYGRPDFRRPENRDKPDCSWQGFTS